MRETTEEEDLEIIISQIREKYRLAAEREMKPYMDRLIHLRNIKPRPIIIQYAPELEYLIAKKEKGAKK